MSSTATTGPRTRDAIAALLAISALALVSAGVGVAIGHASGFADGERAVRLATVVQVDPKGAYFGVCGHVWIPAPAGSPTFLRPARLCATDTPDGSRDLPPGESITLSMELR